MKKNNTNKALMEEFCDDFVDVGGYYTNHQ